jgi:hypothetical protein
MRDNYGSWAKLHPARKAATPSEYSRTQAIAPLAVVALE